MRGAVGSRPRSGGARLRGDVASGGDHLSDLGAVRDQEPLFGAVGSDATAWRKAEAIARDPELWRAPRCPQKSARGCPGGRCGADGPLFIDLDPTLIEAGFAKEGAAGTFKGGFGLRPMLTFLDRPADACGGEPLPGLLRPGNAGANTVADQIEGAAEEALEQLPADMASDSSVLRFDSAGGTHGLLDSAREGRGFSVDFDLVESVREAIFISPISTGSPRLPRMAARGRTARSPGGHRPDRPLRLAGGLGPDRERERPHPGAQLSFTDSGGHRVQAILTDRTETPPSSSATTAPAPAARTRSAAPSRWASSCSPSATSR